MSKPTKEEIKAVMDEVDELDLPDGAHWKMIHDRLGMEYGDLFEILRANLEFFNSEVAS